MYITHDNNTINSVGETEADAVSDLEAVYPHKDFSNIRMWHDHANEVTNTGESYVNPCTRKLYDLVQNGGMGGCIAWGYLEDGITACTVAEIDAE